MEISAHSKIRNFDDEIKSAFIITLCWTDSRRSLANQIIAARGQSTPKRQIAGAVMSPILLKFGQCIEKDDKKLCSKS